MVSLDTLSEVITGCVQFEVSGVGSRLEAPQLTDLRGSQWISVTGGAQVTLPSLRRFVQGSGNWYWLHVEGAGSVLNLPVLDLLQASLDSVTHIQVYGGGQLKLGALKELVTGTLVMDVSGEGTKFELPQLTEIRGRQALGVSGGAQVTLPALHRFVQGATSGWYWLSVDGEGSSIACPTLELLEGNLQDTTILLVRNGGRLIFDTLHEIVTGGVQVSVEGPESRFEAPQLTDLRDRPSFTASAGAQVVLPSLRRFAQGGATGWTWLTANGVGSLIDLPAMESVEGNAATGQATAIQAYNAGRVRLQNLPRIVVGNIQVLSDGIGSLV
ncbi:MAG TPA: hypothetical protein PKW90_29185, partial [Myxococcota bacterium]|nr:hypothetical protein [Myxococcota bacterium]